MTDTPFHALPNKVCFKPTKLQRQGQFNSVQGLYEAGRASDFKTLKVICIHIKKKQQHFRDTVL